MYFRTASWPPVWGFGAMSPKRQHLFGVLWSQAFAYGVVVQEKAYHLISDEGRGGLMKMSFEDATRKLGEEGRIFRKIYGRLSSIGSHFTKERVQYAIRLRGDKAIARLGFLRVQRDTESALRLVVFPPSRVVVALMEAYEQDDVEFPWVEEAFRAYTLDEAIGDEFRTKYNFK